MKKSILFASLLLASGVAVAAGHGNHDGRDGGNGDHGERGNKTDIHQSRFATMDTNADEKVDLQEFLTHSETRFNTMDADSDGFVTKEEARTMRKEMKGHRAHRMMEQHKKSQ